MVPTPPTALIADDEPLLREQLRSRLGLLWPELEISCEADNGLEAVDAYEGGSGPAIAFLDIHMPALSGLDAARRIREITDRRTRIVFVTAYDAYAVKAFEHGAIDYLLKPFETERLAETVSRLRGAWNEPGSTPELSLVLEDLSRRLAGPERRTLQWIKASVGTTVRLVSVDDIVYFHSDEKYTRVVTTDGEVLIRKTIRELAAELDPDRFWQIHRATIVRLSSIAALVRGTRDTAELRLKGRDETLTVSRAYVSRFKQM